VLTKNADVGEIVAPFAASVSAKAAVVTLADMSSLEVEADVSESNIERIKGNQECEITLDAYPDRRYPGFVAKIVPTADRSKATVMVKIGFKSYDSRVLPEMSAKVLFLGEGSSVSTGESKSFLTVPSTAVIAKDGKHYVYIASGSTLLQREVSTGKIAGGLTEIISGLQPGDKVAREANPAFKDGMKFKEE
jgi:RND family efflux transporter MFP subunit